MKRIFALTGGFFLFVLLTACGPSSEEIATMTAPAWTLTPLPPTAPPTSTPVPIDLTVTVTDEDSGAPIAGANLAMQEFGEGASAQTDADGKFSWKNLAGESATLKVSAPGYIPAGDAFSLQRGTNDVNIKLRPAPFGLLTSKACAADEKLLYVEDFQDGAVEGWGTYPPNAPIQIEADADEPDNKILLLHFGNTDGEFQINALPLQDNVVRRFKYNPGNNSRFNVGFGKGNLGYYVVVSANEISLNFYSEATGEQKLMVGKPVMEKGVWHLLEFSSYNGRIEVWADGKLAAAADGTSSLTEGKALGIGSASLPVDSATRIDDISICGMSAPFASIYVPAP